MKAFKGLFTKRGEAKDPEHKPTAAASTPPPVPPRPDALHIASRMGAVTPVAAPAVERKESKASGVPTPRVDEKAPKFDILRHTINPTKAEKDVNELFVKCCKLNMHDEIISESSKPYTLNLFNDFTTIINIGNKIIHMNPLMLVATQNHSSEETNSTMLCLVDGKADINARSPNVNSKSFAGVTAFALAIFFNKFENATALLDIFDATQSMGKSTKETNKSRAEHINIADNNGQNATHYAAQKDDIESLKFIVGKGGNPLLRDKDGKRAVDYISKETDKFSITNIYNQFTKDNGLPAIGIAR
jgi:hypothetical protein